MRKREEASGVRESTLDMPGADNRNLDYISTSPTGGARLGQRNLKNIEEK